MEAQWGKRPKDQGRKTYDAESKSDGLNNSQTTDGNSHAHDETSYASESPSTSPKTVGSTSANWNCANSSSDPTHCCEPTGASPLPESATSQNTPTADGCKYANASPNSAGVSVPQSAHDSEIINISSSESCEGSDLNNGTNSIQFWIGPYLYNKAHEYECISKDSLIWGEDERGFLCDGAIDCFIYLMCKHANDSKIKPNSIAAIPVSLTTYTLDNKNEGFKDGLIKYCTEYQIAKKDIIVFPIVSAKHYKVIIVNTLSKEMLAISSLGPYYRNINANRDTYFAKILRLYYLIKSENPNGEEWNVFSQTQKFQNNTRNCGVFVCFWIYLLCTCDMHYALLNYDDEFMDDFRQYMQYIFGEYEESLKNKVTEKKTPSDPYDYVLRDQQVHHLPHIDKFRFTYRKFSDKTSSKELRERLLSWVMCNEQNIFVSFTS